MTPKPASSVRSWTAAEMSPTAFPATRLLDPGLERGAADVEQPLRVGRDLADRERPRRVGDEAVERDADVDGEDVALAELVRAGDAVHDHRVRRHADRRRVAAVALEGRTAAVRADVVLGERVELAGRDARARFASTSARVPATTRPARAIISISSRRLADDHAGRSLEAAERRLDLGVDLVDRALGVERHELVRRAVLLDERLGLVVVDLEPVARSRRACRRRGPRPARG